MNQDLITQLPRAQREAIESAGYRIGRWVAAREVLQTRVQKGRIAGPLGDFLTHWLSFASPHNPHAELWLSFDYAQDPLALKLAGGVGLVASPLEQALLHLPALRSFWRQELRQRHFEALRVLIPQAWLLDSAQVPPGSVIQGLGAVSWEEVSRQDGREWQIRDAKGGIRENLAQALAAQDSILSSAPVSNVVLNALYGRNEAGQVVLRSIEAAP